MAMKMVYTTLYKVPTNCGGDVEYRRPYRLCTLSHESYHSQGEKIEFTEALLARMEEPTPTDSLAAEERPRKRRGAAASKLPAPTVATYTAIIRAFVQARQYREAMAYAEQLQTRLGYRKGMNPLTDRALADTEWGYTHGRERAPEGQGQDPRAPAASRSAWWNALPTR